MAPLHFALFFVVPLSSLASATAPALESYYNIAYDDCTIETVNASELSLQEFRDQFYANKPVLITNPAAWEGWDLPSLIRDFGGEEVQTGTGAELAMDGTTSGKMFFSQLAKKWASGEGGNNYLFNHCDRHVPGKACFAKVQELYNRNGSSVLPPYFNHSNYDPVVAIGPGTLTLHFRFQAP
jgi:hypothetical protein